MKKIIAAGLLIGFSLSLFSCGSGSGGGRVYRHHHGHSPWWGSGYYRDRVIVVPEKDLEVEATPLPSGPEHMPDTPDMGIPDGDFGDLGGDW